MKNKDKLVASHVKTHNLDFNHCYTTKVVKSLKEEICNPSQLRIWELDHQHIKSKQAPNLNPRLIFGGTIPHWFFLTLDKLVPSNVPNFQMKRVLIERLLFAPLFHAWTLYVLARLEVSCHGKTHKQAVGNLYQVWAPIVRANWQWLTVPMLLNIVFVPSMLLIDTKGKIRSACPVSCICDQHHRPSNNHPMSASQIFRGAVDRTQNGGPPVIRVARCSI
uniref:Peroxisomal membrane protein 2 n=1 Tax=Timema cristinae TaxID=61476 RepID=A0A7R9CXP7_TIMCR|nr:unnamed protein product [Timema cristinae]